MAIKIHVTGWEKWNEVVTWLNTNVGPTMWAQPIVEWHGRGWHVRRTATGYEVSIDDEELAVLTVLRWS
jgi:hypothetical protein